MAGEGLMCIGKRDCQRCETCGLLKYQLWVGPGMHDRGCPWGNERMDACPDALNSAKQINWCLNNGIKIAATGAAFVEQMKAIGADVEMPLIDWTPPGVAVFSIG